MRLRGLVIGSGFGVVLVACTYYTAAQDTAGAPDAAPSGDAVAPGTSSGTSGTSSGSASSSGGGDSDASSSGGGASSSGSSGASSSSTGGLALSAFQQGVLDGFNEKRATAPSASPALPMLTWNDADAAVAKAFTDTCSSANPPNNTLSGGGSPPYTAARVLDRINAAQAHYTYATNGCDSEGACAMYTVIVQRTLVTVGCDMTSCPGEDFWACVVREISDLDAPPY